MQQFLTNDICSCREVLKALTKTRGLYERWRLGEDGAEFRTAEEQEWTATELKNSLRSIEWDVEDLEDTIQVKFSEAYDLELI